MWLSHCGVFLAISTRLSSDLGAVLSSASGGSPKASPESRTGGSPRHAYLKESDPKGTTLIIYQCPFPFPVFHDQDQLRSHTELSARLHGKSDSLLHLNMVEQTIRPSYNPFILVSLRMRRGEECLQGFIWQIWVREALDEIRRQGEKCLKIPSHLVAKRIKFLKITI